MFINFYFLDGILVDELTGYKIELSPEEENMLPPGHQMPGQANGMGLHGPGMIGMVDGQGNMTGMPGINGLQLTPQQQQQLLQQQQQQQQQMMQQHHMHVNGSDGSGGGPGLGMGMVAPGQLGMMPGQRMLPGTVGTLPAGMPRGIGGPSGGIPHGVPMGAPQQPQQQQQQQQPGGQGNGAPGQFKPPQQMQQQHAISYVTNIRNRFANEPETYRAFLKILHTYQKEQKGIKDVLEQVLTVADCR